MSAKASGGRVGTDRRETNASANHGTSEGTRPSWRRKPFRGTFVQYDLSHVPPDARKDPAAFLRPWLTGKPDDEGEQRGDCPLHDDGSNDASFNFRKGTWHCHAGCDGGPLEQLAWQVAIKGIAAPEQRKLRPPKDPDPLPSDARMAGWAQRLQGGDGYTAQVRAWLTDHRNISAETLKRFEVGFDGRCITMPVRAEDGTLVNVRRREPGPGKRVLGLKGHGSKRGWPLPEFIAEAEERPNAPLLICEGELDALVLWDAGFPALTCTGGAGQLAAVIEGHLDLFVGRTILVATDADEPGEEAAEALTDLLDPVATVVVLDHPVDVPDKFDVSDLRRAWGWNFKEELELLIERAAQVDDISSQEVATAYRKLRIRQLAQERLDAERALAAFEFPPSTPTLADDLARDLPPPAYTIQDLHPTGANTLLGAAFKTGKTTLLANVMAAFCDREPFLGLFNVADLEGRVGFLNYELDERQFLAWLRDLGIRNPDRASTLTLRGYRLPLLVPQIEDQVVAWLEEREVQFLVVDTFARAFDGAENSNEEVSLFLEALDVIKRRAGVDDLIISAHLGRQVQEEGRERVRGATRLDDWADVRWLLTSAKGERFLAADGRDVHLDESALRFSRSDRRLTLVGGSRKDARAEAGVREVVRVVAGQPGINKSPLLRAMKGDSNAKSDAVAEAVARKLVRIKTGYKGAQHHHLTKRGREYHDKRFKIGSDGRDETEGVEAADKGAEEG